jgi:hypothetical protein
MAHGHSRNYTTLTDATTASGIFYNLHHSSGADNPNGPSIQPCQAIIWSEIMENRRKPAPPAATLDINCDCKESV